VTDFSNTDSLASAGDAEGDVERDLGSLSGDDARALNDEIGIPASQAIGGLAGDAESGEP
jgi:hypothetical protein